MPLICYEYDREFEEWENWLHGHTLAQTNGCWLSDRRDNIPLLPYLRIQNPDIKNWHKEYNENDFINRLIIKKDNDYWININASWEINYNGLREHISIHSALVYPSAAPSLLNAWNSFDNPYDYKLPEYDEEQFEKNEHPFKLKGYIIRENKSYGIDNYDSAAEDLDFPPYKLGELYANILELTHDTDLRFWYEPDNNIPAMECIIWNSGKEGRGETIKNNGKYLSISFNLLKKLCIETEMDIIIEIVIRREKDRQEETEDYGKEKRRQTRLFLFTADGRFRDATTYYQFR